MNIAAQGKMAITLLRILKICPPPLKEQSCSSELGGVWLRCTGLKASVGTHFTSVKQSNTTTGSLLLFFCFTFSFFFLFHFEISHLAAADKMELFIPSMACMSAALGSNSQRDRLWAPPLAPGQRLTCSRPPCQYSPEPNPYVANLWLKSESYSRIHSGSKKIN